MSFGGNSWPAILPGKGVDDVKPPGVGFNVIARKMAVIAITCGGCKRGRSVR